MDIEHFHLAFRSSLYTHTKNICHVCTTHCAISYDWIFVFLPGVSGGELLVPRTHLKSGYSGRRGSGDEASLRHGHLNHRAAARRGSGDVDLLRRSLTHKADGAGE